jgi:hypothetical protein
MKKHFLAALAALTLAAPVVVTAPLAALAQSVPTYDGAAAPAQDGEENVHGRIVSFDGNYSLQVRDERGYLDNVQMHQGTIINPTGITLAPGMVVSILGYDAGGYLAANEIDTPYTFYDGAWCYDGHPWSYWGPSVGLAFFFGNVGWWHGGYFGGPFAWIGGARYYVGVGYWPRGGWGWGWNRYGGVWGNHGGGWAYHPGGWYQGRGNGYNGHVNQGSLASRPSPVREHPVPLGAGSRPSYARGAAYDSAGYRGSYGGNAYRGSYGGNAYRGSYGGGSYRGSSGGGSYGGGSYRGSYGGGAPHGSSGGSHSGGGGAVSHGGGGGGRPHR